MVGVVGCHASLSGTSRGYLAGSSRANMGRGNGEVGKKADVSNFDYLYAYKGRIWERPSRISPLKIYRAIYYLVRGRLKIFQYKYQYVIFCYLSLASAWVSGLPVFL